MPDQPPVIVYIDSGNVETQGIEVPNRDEHKELHYALERIRHRYTASHYSFSFIDHGGSPNQLGLYERDSSKVWLSTGTVASMLRTFRRTIGRPLDLLYLQVCAKGNIESLYDFRDIAYYTLYSQHIMFAPNYYYPETMQRVAREPSIGGDQLARLIVTFEAPEMYLSMSCIDNSKWEAVHSAFKKLDKPANRGQVEERFLHTTGYAGYTYWDLISFLEAMELERPANRKTKSALLAYLRDEFIVMYHVNPLYEVKLRGFCGLSLIGAPLKRTQREFPDLDWFKK